MFQKGAGRGGGLQFIHEQTKNTALYAPVFIKRDEWFHYINMKDGEHSEKAES